jgi:hypothetical protein
MEATAYDGTVLTSRGTYTFGVSILDPATISNKIGIVALNRTYNPNISSGYYIQ